MIKVGDRAPGFQIPDTKKEMTSLESLRGKTVVLAFYPGAFTGVCTKEMCALRDSITAFESLDAKVLGISVDSPFANGAFAEKHGIGFPLLSDYKRDVARAYDVLLENFAGLEGLTATKRAVFVVDPEGVVRYAWVGATPAVEPSYDEVKAAVESLRGAKA